MEIEIPTPSAIEVKKYLKRWGELDNYVLQERSLRKLFNDTYPLNSDIDDVLIKVCSLNDFYSTNIFSPFSISKHIVSLDMDSVLKSGDADLVNKIARVKIKNKVFNFYSFASKYCSHHMPEDYPIYDSYVRKMLIHFKKKSNFSKFKSKDLKDYQKFKETLFKFREYYQLEEFSLKQIDKYLWLCGKEYFKNEK